METGLAAAVTAPAATVARGAAAAAVVVGCGCPRQNGTFLSSLAPLDPLTRLPCLPPPPLPSAQPQLRLPFLLPHLPAPPPLHLVLTGRVWAYRRDTGRIGCRW